MTTETENNTQEARSSAAHCSGALVRIHWKSKITGASGSGQPIARQAAEAWLRDVEPRYPELKHWLVEA